MLSRLMISNAANEIVFCFHFQSFNNKQSSDVFFPLATLLITECRGVKGALCSIPPTLRDIGGVRFGFGIFRL